MYNQEWITYLRVLRGTFVAKAQKKGRGHWGHKGRKGKRGGSLPSKRVGGWKPVMTAGDAKEWNAGTALAKQTFYHHTESRNIEGIKKEGFHPGEGFYGKGTYLTTDPEYSPMLDSVRVAVKAENPVYGRREMDKLYERHDPEFTMEPLQLLSIAGKDAWVLPRTDGSTWVMVPNREQTVVVEG